MLGKKLEDMLFFFENAYCIIMRILAKRLENKRL